MIVFKTFNQKLGSNPVFVFGGGGEIRTHDTIAGIAVFKTARFNHSRTPPYIKLAFYVKMFYPKLILDTFRIEKLCIYR